MSKPLTATVVAAALLGAALHAQKADSPKPSDSPVTMTGCVSAKPATTGQYTFDEADGLRQYRLNGKNLRKFAGQRVEVVGGSPGSGGGLTIKGGLWPAPSGGARGVALDPAQAAIANQQARAGGPGNLPEFKVATVRLVPGACEEVQGQSR